MMVMRRATPQWLCSHHTRSRGGGRWSGWPCSWTSSSSSPPSSAGSVNPRAARTKTPCTSFQSWPMSMVHLRSREIGAIYQLLSNNNVIKLHCTVGFYIVKRITLCLTANIYYFSVHILLVMMKVIFDHKKFVEFLVSAKTKLLPAEQIMYLTQTIKFWFIN